MALTKQRFTAYLKNADFKTLFIEEMGWNKVSSSSSRLPRFTIGETTFEIINIAQRSGFQVLVCNISELPSNATCKKLDTKLRKAANDYICIFVKQDTEHHLWVAPVKTNEKRDIVIIEYAEAEKAQFLYEKLAGLSFRVDEETTIVDVKERVQGAFAINSEKITKDFYTGFSKQHKAFAEFISGIDDQTATKDNKNKQWYTSVMLNRLMFCYFIQKKGFLDGDENYLCNKLHWVQEQRGNDKFFKSFYKGFLIQLFRGGLNSPKHDNSFENIYGRIPYLNGGMFDVHQIERDYADIDIKDEAFESLFEFFDKWRWHLDTRVTASGRDINPDVLGYIFEQYINDRAQMGAYYTKEDITEYIGRNTIIPYLLDSVAQKYPSSFVDDGPFWSFIKNSGDSFIFDAVKKGADQIIPEEVAIGIDTYSPRLLERRKVWNEPTPERIGLPNEIWRETIERVGRFKDIRDKIGKGVISSTRDFITYNLNTPKIAYDFLNSTNDAKFIELFYNELLHVTILDPTCGSGAFLFAALNLLEPLYEVCISRMEEFNQRDGRAFKEQLAEIQNKYRSNIQYFIYKSIILRNLFGVDIMAEAVEIAKLRLFLKMVAVVEVDRRADNLGLDPLPDVDFNIRCGNTLVGYADRQSIEADLFGDNVNLFLVQESSERINEQLDLVSVAYDVFREEQLVNQDSITSYKQAKEELSKALMKLNAELNNHMFKASGISSYEKWLEDYQPFHWISEFYQIISEGGFDVIIGNPPYVEYSKVRGFYTINGFDTLPSANLYSFVIERSYSIIADKRYLGMIIPISAFCTDRMESLMRCIFGKSSETYISNYAERPSKLFEGAERNLSIFVSHIDKNEDSNEPHIVYSSKYYLWKAENRILLFQNISYEESTDCILSANVPKIGTPIEKSILRKLRAIRRNIGYETVRNSNYTLYYKNSGGRYWKFIADFKPVFYLNGTLGTSSRETHLYFDSKEKLSCMVAIINSSLYYWYYVMHSDARTNNPSDLKDFPLDYSKLSSETKTALTRLCEQLMTELKKNSVLTEATYRTGDVVFAQYLPALSKETIDEIDHVLGRHFGLTAEEIDFVLSYNIKFRITGDETEE